jgi:N-acetylneuraminic acid mutarotase
MKPLRHLLIMSLGLSLSECLAADWQRLPAIPDAEGFAAPFAGVSGGALVVAGGANFPDKKPWEGGTKVWHDGVFLLERPTGPWRSVGLLPRPLAYGVSLTVADGVWCIGGSDARQHYAEVFVMRWDGAQWQFRSGPPLPQPVANACGALLDGVAYVAGGIATPTATRALHTFYALDLRAVQPQWRELPAWPGRERMLAIAGAHGGAFYLFGGCALKADAEGKPVREWLRDAYRFRPGEGWKRIADLPRVAVAAPSPAPVFQGRLWVIGGDDGAQVDKPPTEHRGFPRTVLAYDPLADRWEIAGEVPFSLVTTPAVRWGGALIVPGGEARPGVRSTEVWSLPAR